MSTHLQHRMHAHSIEAWAGLDTETRRAAIFAVYRDSVQALTDRDVMERLGFTDGNHVKPRISEMVRDGLLCEVGKVRDEITRRRVRVCTNTRIVL